MVLNRLRLCAFAFFLTIGSAISAVETPRAKGLRIAIQSKEKSDGFVGEKSKMKLTLIDAYGAKTVRIMEGKILEVKGEGDKSLSIFLNPKDVKGTKMLTWSHKSDNDDQWLYLPSIRRVKRISSGSKSSSFMGSEFSYEDLGSQETEKYNFKFIKDAVVGGKKVWVVERIPKIKSGYKRQVMYISKKLFNTLRVEYYDRKDELLKVAVFSNFKKYKIKGKTLFRANKIHMKNVQTKKQSIFAWDSRKLGVKFSSREFKKSSLK